MRTKTYPLNFTTHTTNRNVFELQFSELTIKKQEMNLSLKITFEKQSTNRYHDDCFKHGIIF